jgi:3-hydroxy-9,10-secoandrosta-1,3,5(10)-triene-9,17-dione monooxygenase
MRPYLVEHQGDTEKLTHITEETHRMFGDADFYLMLIPKAHGGLEVTPRTFMKVTLEIARGDMSAAWNFMLSANHSLMLANWFPVEIHEEIYNGGDFRAASMYAPSVRAKKVDGGWQINGTVNYCSGIPYSTYFLGQAILEGKNADGTPRMGMYIAPKSAFTILDDWGDTLGLRGSGSNSIRFDDAIIDERFMVEDEMMGMNGYDGDSPGSAAYGNPMYSGRHMSTFALCLAAIVIGGGLNALDEYENQMRTRKTTVPPFIPRTEDPDFLRYYGSAFTKLQLAEASLMNALDQWLDLATGNVAGEKPFTAADDNRLGGIGRELMLQVWECVDTDLMRTIGSGALRTGLRFDRLFRDLAMSAGHRNPQLRDFAFRQIAIDQLGLAEPV